MEHEKRYGEAVILTFAVAVALCVIGIVIAQDHDFRAVYLYAQSLGLAVMLLVGVSGGSQAYAKFSIISALVVCLVFDLWLSVRGPVYLEF